MEFIQLKCPNCQATLEAEDTLDTIFCKYCGTRIVIADQSKNIIEAKTKLKMADKQLEMEKERNQHELEKKKIEALSEYRFVLLYVLLLLGCLLYLYGTKTIG